ncbi:hypothetical protein H0H92_010545 [Tricholoma furcatifolium]|nr:hypothetical protein H0H92_010545 [Tricholoma furcatifolium]
MKPSVIAALLLSLTLSFNFTEAIPISTTESRIELKVAGRSVHDPKIAIAAPLLPRNKKSRSARKASATAYVPNAYQVAMKGSLQFKTHVRDALLTNLMVALFETFITGPSKGFYQ